MKDIKDIIFISKFVASSRTATVASTKRGTRPQLKLTPGGAPQFARGSPLSEAELDTFVTAPGH